MRALSSTRRGPVGWRVAVFAGAFGLATAALLFRGPEPRRPLALALLAAGLAPAVFAVRRALGTRQRATTDDLTGVPNRRAVMEWLGASLDEARARRGAMAVLLVDVDHFTRVNDAHGPAVGDEVLRRLVPMLAASLRTGDRLGRVGGEEFAVVLPRTRLAEAHALAERMRVAVATSPVVCGGVVVAVTVSIGVAGSDGVRHAIDLLTRADAALSRAKSWGRDRVVVHEAGGWGTAEGAPRPGREAPRARWQRGVGA